LSQGAGEKVPQVAAVRRKADSRISSNRQGVLLSL